MEKFYTSKYDKVFKAIFCTDENKHMMIKLLSTILNKNITDITFLNNEIPVSKVSERSKTVDVLALASNEYIHIELNSSCSKYLHIRNFIYFSEIYSKKARRGEMYDYKTNFIHIDLTYGLKENDNVLEYFLMTENKIRYIENIKYVEFNMDKLKEYCYTEASEEYEKFKYLIMLDMTKEDLNKVKKDEFMSEYKEKVEKLNDDKTFISAISYEDDQKFTLNTEKQISFDEGLEQGIQEGVQSNKCEIVKEMYKHDYTLEQISSIVKLSIGEIKKILNLED